MIELRCRRANPPAFATQSRRSTGPQSRRSTGLRAISIARATAVVLALAAVALGKIFACPALAQNARFDLAGPSIDVRVTRAGVTLPIASVPNLQPGDRLWLHPDLPDSQSVHYLLVLAFLRGTTNPPPDKWFTRIATWDKKVRAEGVEVTVPSEAQQAVLFLAPVTGGDFTTLRSAVQGRPGVFVRASQDLTAAGFEQARIEKYIASMRQLSPVEAADPRQLQEHSNLIAATLALKPNGDCVKLPPDQQYTCLTQSGNQSLLDDGHGQSIIASLTGGETAGLIGTASGTQLAGAGLYSAYVGTVVDLVHIMGSLHTAQYQYIPAIAFPEQQALNLRLNTPPSFHNPKSVLVIGLPSVQSTIPPPLRAADPTQVACLVRPHVVLPVDGAPLVFSTGFAHDLVLHLNYPLGSKPAAVQPQDIPITADAFRGGLVLAPQEKRRALRDNPPDSAKSFPSASKDPASPGSGSKVSDSKAAASGLTGTVEGYWGFDSFTGPTMQLEDAPGKDWKLASNGAAEHWLISGKDRHVLVTSTGTACVESVALDPADGKQESATWKPGAQPGTIDVNLDIPSRDAGAMHLAIRQFGDSKPATIALTAYSEPARLDALSYHAGDTAASLTGTSLDQVRQLELAGLTFKPAGLASSSAQPGGRSELRVALSANASPPAVTAGSRLTAKVALDDGRTLNLPLAVEPARPVVTLIARADIPAASARRSQFPIRLGTQTDLPVGDALTFSLRSTQPFPRDGAIEIASPDGSLHTRLSVAENTLVLEDPHTLLATFEPLKVFGPSAFGAIQLRAIAPDGATGDWLPLATLVRLPAFIGLSCPVAMQPAQGAPPAPDISAPPAHAASPTSDAPTASPVSDPSTATPAPPGPSTPSPIPPPAQQQAAMAPPVPPAVTCTLTGTGLYFVDSVAANQSFADPTHVPEGYVGSSLEVPPPAGAVYYLRLRDDPANIGTITLPAGPLDRAANP